MPIFNNSLPQLFRIIWLKQCSVYSPSSVVSNYKQSFDYYIHFAIGRCSHVLMEISKNFRHLVSEQQAFKNRNNKKNNNKKRPTKMPQKKILKKGGGGTTKMDARCLNIILFCSSHTKTNILSKKEKTFFFVFFSKRAGGELN